MIRKLVNNPKFKTEIQKHIGNSIDTQGLDREHEGLQERLKHISIPIIHIAEATAGELKKNGISKVGLLGTKYTMIQEFYKNKLIDAGIDVVIPNREEVEIVNNIIYNELCLGIISEESKMKYLAIE